MFCSCRLEKMSPPLINQTKSQIIVQRTMNELLLLTELVIFLKKKKKEKEKNETELNNIYIFYLQGQKFISVLSYT